MIDLWGISTNCWQIKTSYFPPQGFLGYGLCWHNGTYQYVLEVLQKRPVPEFTDRRKVFARLNNFYASHALTWCLTISTPEKCVKCCLLRVSLLSLVHKCTLCSTAVRFPRWDLRWLADWLFLGLRISIGDGIRSPHLHAEVCVAHVMLLPLLLMKAVVMAVVVSAAEHAAVVVVAAVSSHQLSWPVTHPEHVWSNETLYFIILPTH